VKVHFTTSGYADITLKDVNGNLLHHRTISGKYPTIYCKINWTGTSTDLKNKMKNRRERGRVREKTNRQLILVICLRLL
jgi:hypothetical protein